MFLCKNVLLYTIINIFKVLEIIIDKFSCMLNMMSRNTFPEPQPDSASYRHVNMSISVEVNFITSVPYM